MPTVGFIDADDPMWLSTLRAMDDELVTDSLVYRYDPAASPDGLRGSEGTFSLCTFAYVDALARAGRLDEARLAFEKMLTYANHVGLYSEEIAPDRRADRQLPAGVHPPRPHRRRITLDAALDSAHGNVDLTGLLRSARVPGPAWCGSGPLAAVGRGGGREPATAGASIGLWYGPRSRPTSSPPAATSATAAPSPDPDHGRVVAKVLDLTLACGRMPIQAVGCHKTVVVIVRPSWSGGVDAWGRASAVAALLDPVSSPGCSGQEGQVRP